MFGRGEVITTASQSDASRDKTNEDYMVSTRR